MTTSEPLTAHPVQAVAWGKVKSTACARVYARGSTYRAQSRYVCAKETSISSFCFPMRRIKIEVQCAWCGHACRSHHAPRQHTHTCINHSQQRPRRSRYSLPPVDNLVGPPVFVKSERGAPVVGTAVLLDARMPALGAAGRWIPTRGGVCAAHSHEAIQPNTRLGFLYLSTNNNALQLCAARSLACHFNRAQCNDGSK